MKTPTQVKLMLRLHDLETGANEMDVGHDFQKLEKKIDPSLLKFYRKLRKRKQKGVAIMKNHMCSECRMVYPATHEIFRHTNTLQICEFCGRILVVTDSATSLN